MLLPRQLLIIIYKSFIRPLLDYGNVIYDQPPNESLSHRIESLQYKAALAIIGAIKESSRTAIPEIRFRALASKVVNETIVFIL